MPQLVSIYYHPPFMISFITLLRFFIWRAYVNLFRPIRVLISLFTYASIILPTFSIRVVPCSKSFLPIKLEQVF